MTKKIITPRPHRSNEDKDTVSNGRGRSNSRHGRSSGQANLACLPFSFLRVQTSREGTSWRRRRRDGELGAGRLRGAAADPQGGGDGGGCRGEGAAAIGAEAGGGGRPRDGRRGHPAGGAARDIGGAIRQRNCLWWGEAVVEDKP
jgi:hypothetical protein